MARQIIKQPNGLFAEFSSITDSFVMWDATKEEIIQAAVKDAEAHAIEQCEDIFERIEKGTEWKSPFKLSWAEAVKAHNKSYPENKIEI
jgi:hypothetical protein